LNSVVYGVIRRKSAGDSKQGGPVFTGKAYKKKLSQNAVTLNFMNGLMELSDPIIASHNDTKDKT
jgi:hypothetical protein